MLNHNFEGHLCNTCAVIDNCNLPGIINTTPVIQFSIEKCGGYRKSIPIPTSLARVRDEIESWLGRDCDDSIDCTDCKFGSSLGGAGCDSLNNRLKRICRELGGDAE